MRGVRRLRRFLALPGADRRGLAAAWVALAVTDVELRVVGFRRLIRHIEQPTRSRPRPPQSGDIDQARRSAMWLAVASRRHVAPAYCLHRSLSLHAKLRREGLPSELRIGVRKQDGVLRAHAWVELGGQVINDSTMSVRAFTQLANIGDWPYSRTRGRLDPVVATPAAPLADEW